ELMITGFELLGHGEHGSAGRRFGRSFLVHVVGWWRSGTFSLIVLQSTPLTQLAQLAAIPFPHVGQMADHFFSLLGDDTLLLLNMLGLLSQTGGGGVDLPDLLVHLGLPSFQACLAMRQGSF